MIHPIYAHKKLRKVANDAFDNLIYRSDSISDPYQQLIYEFDAYTDASVLFDALNAKLAKRDTKQAWTGKDKPESKAVMNESYDGGTIINATLIKGNRTVCKMKSERGWFDYNGAPLKHVIYNTEVVLCKCDVEEKEHPVYMVALTFNL